MRPGYVYDKGALVKSLLILIGTAVLMKATGGAGFLLVVPLVLSTLMMRRADKLFFYILLTTAMLVANPNVVPKDVVFGISQRVLMMILGVVMSVQLLGSRLSRYTKPILGIFPYVLFMIIPSAMGWSPKISFLKLFLFTMIFLAYFGVANQAAQSRSLYGGVVRSEMLAVAIFFIAGSVALIPFPGIGQLRGDQFLDNPNATSLFMGMTSQSQALGPAISALAVILLGDLLFSVKKPDKLYLALLLCCPILIYKTSSRTGMGSFLLGLGYVVWLFMRAKGIGSRWRGKVMSIATTVVLLCVLVVVAVPSVRSGAIRFALKVSGESKRELSAENVLSSRQGKIDECLANFHKKPLIGNGFQVSENMAYNRDKGGLILSAPIEKGVWIYAVLEEGGAIGFVLFAGFLLFTIHTLAKRRCYIGAGCLFVCALTNLGEFTFFSMTYMGGFIWSMVFAGVAMDVQRIRQETRGAFRPPWAGIGMV